MADRETIELAATAEASAKRKVTSLTLQNLVWGVSVIGSVFLAYGNIKSELSSHTDQINRIEKVQETDHTVIEEIKNAVGVLKDRSDSDRRHWNEGSTGLDQNAFGAVVGSPFRNDPVQRGNEKSGAHRPDQSETR
jgi:hypothetical protein